MVKLNRANKIMVQSSRLQQAMDQRRKLHQAKYKRIRLQLAMKLIYLSRQVMSSPLKAKAKPIRSHLIMAHHLRLKLTMANHSRSHQLAMSSLLTNKVPQFKPHRAIDQRTLLNSLAMASPTHNRQDMSSLLTKSQHII